MYIVSRRGSLLRKFPLPYSQNGPNTFSTMVNRIKIANIPALCRSNCRIKHPERVETLINAIIDAGTERLQLISDFDFTISKHRLADGSRMHSSFYIIDKCSSIPQSVRDRNKMLCKKYRPIEVDGRIAIPDKLKAMIEWWTESSNSYWYVNILLGITFLFFYAWFQWFQVGRPRDPGGRQNRSRLFA